MTDFSKLTPEQLEKMDKQVLITIIGALQGQLNTISSQINFLTEQIALMNQRSFGRKTEKKDSFPNQLSFSDYYDNEDVFNEPEYLSDSSKEPEITEVIISSYTRKKKTTREANLEGLPARIFEHVIETDRLKELFPNGYKELPVETYKRLAMIPQTFLVDEHHIHVYASKDNDGTIVRAERPKDLFRNSIATASVVSVMMNAKFANHQPLERQVQFFKNFGVNLKTNTAANWMINASEQYLTIIYDELHKHLYDSEVIHADETPFQVIRDDRSPGSKSYMWVYRNGACSASHPVIIYDYQSTRKTDHPEEFLKNYNGVLVTDGYQVYHTLANKREGLKVAGCWVHAKRKYSEIVKALGKEKADLPDGIIAAKAEDKISKIFHEDNLLDGLSKRERKKQRQQKVKPLVDKFFEWVKQSILKLPAESATAKALQYSINQEDYLRVFLSDPNVPMDNNPAEQSIRPFTLGRKNWVAINSPKGADASAVIYSLVETAKANHLSVQAYLEYLLTELPKHVDDKDRSFIADLLPWSKAAQKKCAAPKKS